MNSQVVPPMTISARDKKLVQESFTKVVPMSDAAAKIFYKKLFEMDPTLKPLFKSDMRQQGKKLMMTLKVAVDTLNDLDALVPVLQELSARHVKYGVQMDDYTPVGNALLYTLQAGLGPDWTPDHRNAWISVYRTVAQVMKTHAYPGYNHATYKNKKAYNKP
jgi:nitric oxide dioxygenase